MKLMMYLRNDLIETVPLDATLVSKPGYLGSIKRGLKEKYQTLLKEAGEPADFLVVHPDPPAPEKESTEAE